MSTGDSAKSSTRPSRKTVAEVRAALCAAPFEELSALADSYEDDERASVAKLVAQARSRYTREARERTRVEGMYALMRELGGNGIVIGVDEVGRGSVAGPLTVAAVALADEPRIWGLDDSKRLTAAQRTDLAAKIKQHALAIGIAHIEPGEIDACGMAASLRVAMRRAIADAGIEPDAVLLDGVPLHIHPLERAVTHGDARIACIAAASIVAKVTRDAIMVAAEETYPGYQFAASKGYASAEHIAAIRARGLTDFHRASFCQNFLAEETIAHE